MDSANSCAKEDLKQGHDKKGHKLGIVHKQIPDTCALTYTPTDVAENPYINYILQWQQITCK